VKNQPLKSQITMYIQQKCLSHRHRHHHHLPTDHMSEINENVYQQAGSAFSRKKPNVPKLLFIYKLNFGREDRSVKNKFFPNDFVICFVCEVCGSQPNTETERESEEDDVRSRTNKQTNKQNLKKKQNN
jgi:hypothetical protein